MDDLSRDILAAVLAVLTDAIPRPGLAAALQAWSEKRDQPLAEVLKAATGLDDERLRALECLAAVHLKTHDDDLRLSLKALNAEGLTANLLTEIDDAGSMTTLGATLACESTTPMDPAPSGDKALEFSVHPPPVAKDERFQLIRQHAQGGIGQVWLARDSELQREVAVKEIQPRYAEREDQRARFVLEAEITGSLEHPGIVPVYSLGRNAEGRPYYAMRFIRGESLSVEIQRFHKKYSEEVGDPATKAVGRSKWGIEFRQLIGRFLDVCDAIDYAHSRGVLHRDLKPANIMLGPYGETLVVDWGLAKVIGKPEAPRPAAEGNSEPGPQEADETLPEGTQQGTTIGTPAYMSPEQARGLIDQLGPASDVYSLGASLYELLTGKAPFHEKKIAQVIVKVIAGDFPAPRVVDRSIPVPLEAICLKAMAKEPEARYGSVRALARDLEHWLADEPTAAHPESALEQLGRWIRQHRALTYTAAAALMAISMVAIIAAVVIDGARRSETVARQEAETNFDMAQKAVEDYLTSVSENTLLKEQDSVDIRSLRQELLRSALTYYEKFASQRKNDPLLRRQLANAYFRVGQITREIDSHAKAIGAFRSAKAIWEPLFESNTKDHEVAGNLSECYLDIGRLQSLDNNFPAALNTLGQARTILERLTAEKPSEARYQATLADCYSEIGIVHSELDQPDQSLVLHEKARAIQEGLINRYPGKLAYRKSLAENINAIGHAYAKRLDNDAAIKAFQEVRDICESFMKEVPQGPKPVWLLNLLALSQYNIGVIHKKNKAIEAALPFFEQSLGYRSALADSHPSVTQFHEKLAVSYREISELQHVAHQDSKAFASIQKSIDVLDALVRAHPDQASLHGKLAFSWNYLGVLHDEARKNADAIGPFEQAVREQRLAVEKAEHAEIYKRDLCYYFDNLGEQYIDLGRLADGLPWYQRALRIHRELNAAHPGNREYALDLVNALIKLGTIQRHAADPGAARQLFTEAQRVLNKWLGTATDDGTFKARRALLLDSEANTLADQNLPKLARPPLEQATSLFRQLATRTAPADQVVLETAWRSEALWDLGRVLRALKLPSEAERFDTERRDLLKTRPGDELVALALEQLSRATLIGYGKTARSAEAMAVRDLDLDQAADLVRLAVSQGIKGLGKLKSHPDSTFLLERDDLNSLIEGLQSANPPTGARSPKKARDP